MAGTTSKSPGESFPAVLAGAQAYPPVEDMNCGLAGAVVLIEAVASGQRDQRLAQHVLVPAVHGVRAASAGGLPGEFKLSSGKSGQRGLP